MSLHRRRRATSSLCRIVSLAVMVFALAETAFAAQGTPPTAVCTGQCQTCLEFSGPDNRCLKCGIDPKCLPSPADPGLRSDFTTMLNAHNAYRARHGVPALTWSPQVAAGAQSWANACTPDPKNKDRFAHSPDAWKSESGYGENLFWGPRTTATNAVDWWYAEIKEYDFNKPDESFKAGDTKSAKEVRHFTQVVWRNSKQLGCGVKDCNGRNFWVCRYSPPGNLNAQNQGVLTTNVPRPQGAIPATQSKLPMPTSPGAPVNRGEWSAFATDSRGNWGYGAHRATQEDSQKLAIDGCGGAGIGCKVFWTTRDRCVSYTESRNGGYWYAAGGGTSRDQAVESAIRFCQSDRAPANTCKPVVAECR